ncbi:MAG: DUF5689 domain-containing protein [Porphyromonadaceae bacterium]|nr:DUF5689 domain-containing protein [Porphyromonadaceae bacterium]
MKWLQTLAVFAAILGLTTACNYNRPDEPAPQNRQGFIDKLKPTHTVAQLKAIYPGTPLTIAEDVIVSATIASDDTEGNLYRTCYIQDETGGLELKLSLGNLSTIYPQGSKIYLRARGMTLGRYADHINLGYRSLDPKYETAFYPEKLAPEVLLFVERGSVVPRKLSIANVNPKYAGTLVQIDGVQFSESELNLTYAAPDDRKSQGYVNRTLVDQSGRTLIVRTSSYAKFAGRKLPQGSGSITAILTYFRDTPQLLLLRESDARMSAPRF